MPVIGREGEGVRVRWEMPEGVVSEVEVMVDGKWEVKEDCN